ncbi:acyltransferase-like protein [Novosphingobium sp. PhB165]|uniref:acyltransferase family protein n=1 Tax=Novosphingobium sp. PhB165 TaxID=2485105 RepID=UPI001049797F|nr:acyltransferase [Novosphingobium sp. PhB165]TCM22177.1 acyltransferase-like protein [Novosphingobium sp. PhB165]
MTSTLIADPSRKSAAISIARVICILGVVYVHAWTGLTGYDLQLARGTPQDDFRWVLMDVFGRSAVPLLGLISGWLVASSSRTRDWPTHVARKARTILLPMVLWNALALLLVSGTAWLLNLPAPTPHSFDWVFEELFVASRNPDINVQMPFLRDLFVCMLAAPWLVRLANPWLVAIASIAAVCQIVGIGAPVVMRASIPFFFVLGILARRENFADRVASWPLPVALLPFASLMALQLFLTLRYGMQPDNAASATLDLAIRLTAAAAYWRLAWALSASPLKTPLLRIEPFAFFLFCSHLILIWLGGPLLGALFGKLGSPLYPYFLLAQPFIVLLAVVALGTALVRAAPGPAKVLSGGRLAAA